MKPLPAKINGFRSSIINSIIDAIRERTVVPGPGTRASETAAGMLISVPPPPPPQPEKPSLFQVRAQPNESGGRAVEVWLPGELGGVVRRNGWPVEPQGAYVVAEPGWFSLASGIAVSAAPKFVVLRCKWDYPTLSKPSGCSGDLYWTIGIETSTAAAAIDRFETPVILASIVDGVAHQLHVGAAETWCTLADSEVDAATDHQSLGWRGDLPADTDGHFLELFQFCQMEQISAIDLSAVFSGSADPDHDLNILIRTWDAASSTARLDYSTLDGLMDEYAKSDPTTGEFVEWLGSIIHEYGDGDCAYANQTGHACPFLAGVNLLGPGVFDPTTGTLVEAPFWEQGGDETTCYGTAIGDAAKTKIIDLAAKKLLLGWTAWDSNATQTADFENCRLIDGAAITIDWLAKELVGAWKIQAGGSLATPSFELNGTTVTGVSTVAVVTGVNFGAQTVTTTNVKVLT